MKVSIIVPIHNMVNADQLLRRNLDSIQKQTFKDYEIIISDDSEGELWPVIQEYPVRYFKNTGHKGMANNTNFGISQAKGDWIKILFLDDFFFTPESLEDIYRHLTRQTMWLATACTHLTDNGTYFNNHIPFYSQSENTIGSPSVVIFRREVEERFDPRFHWVIDLDFYKRLFINYGRPKILEHINIGIGIHPGQMTNILPDSVKQQEFELLNQKYV